MLGPASNKDAESARPGGHFSVHLWRARLPRPRRVGAGVRDASLEVFGAQGALSDRVLVAGGGDDVVGTGAGADTVSAGPGNDRVATGGGADSVNPGSGRDRVSTGPGHDQVGLAGTARDRVDCGTGAGNAGRDRADRLSRCEAVRPC
jgi:RTX calcium-binding nonapeptide repeat (4 copies)